MADAVTKKDLHGALGGLRADLKEDIRDLVQHFLGSQNAQDEKLAAIIERLATVDAKLDAVMELLSTRKQLQILVRQLKAHGIALDESKIFS